MRSGNLFSLRYCTQTGEDTAVCDHCDTMDSVLANLVGRKVTNVIMRKVKAELHNPINRSNQSPMIDCAIRRKE
jgi:hypothetical protein